MADAIGACGGMTLAAPAANGTVSTPATGNTTQASGSVFLVGVTYGAGVGPNATTPVTDNKGNTYTKLGGIASVGGNPPTAMVGCEIYYSSNASPAGGSNHQWTLKIAGTSGDAGISALEVTGLSQTTDQSGNTFFNQKDSSSTSQNSVAMTTTNADDIAFIVGTNSGDAAQTQAFSAVQGGGTWTIPTSGSSNNTTFGPSAIAYQLVESATTYQAGYNTGAAAQVLWATGIQSMQASAGGGPTAALVDMIGHGSIPFART